MIDHRGPDGEGLWSDGMMALGHRRLAIIGPGAGGNQPMRSASGRSVICFNGEIYNYLELAECLRREGVQANTRYDTSVLVEALERWGTDCLAELNGMFAIAWYRPELRRLTLIRDRWGKKPLYWGTVELPDGSRPLVFCSELGPIGRLPGGRPRPDPLGVARYLVYDAIVGERTVYRDVGKLPPGEWVDLDSSGTILNRGRFWRYAPRPRPGSVPEAREEYERLLIQAVKLRLRSDVPVGLFLSGGIDSSLVAAAWRRAMPEGEINSYTVGFEDPSFDESRFAREAANSVGAVHHEIVVTGRELEEEIDRVWRGLSEPFGDPSIVPTSLVCRLARRDVTVVLAGDGGDELQAGYDPFKAWAAAKALERILPPRCWRRLISAVERVLPVDERNMSLRFKLHHFGQGIVHPRNERVQAWLASFSVPEALAVMRPELAAEVNVDEILAPSRSAFEASLEGGELAAQQATWVETYLEGSILTKVDRASMLNSLEARAPLLDPSLAAFCAGLPRSLVFDRGRGKVLMRQVARDWLPADISSRRKKGFGVPVGTWLRGVLRERMEHFLSNQRNDEWFATERVRGLWRSFLAGEAECRKALWTFLFSQPFRFMD